MYAWHAQQLTDDQDRQGQRDKRVKIERWGHPAHVVQQAVNQLLDARPQVGHAASGKRWRQEAAHAGMVTALVFGGPDRLAEDRGFGIAWRALGRRV